MDAHERDEVHRLLDALISQAPGFGDIELAVFFRGAKVQRVEHHINASYHLLDERPPNEGRVSHLTGFRGENPQGKAY